MPFLHCCENGHTVPHLPHAVSSLAKSMHTPLHSVELPRHTQKPFTQAIDAGLQGKAPQQAEILSAKLRRRRREPTASRKGAVGTAHLGRPYQMQCSCCVSRFSTEMSPVPPLIGSNTPEPVDTQCTVAQPPPPRVYHQASESEHTHHTLPQAPQLKTSACVLTQALLQLERFSLHTQRPFLHACELGQLLTVQVPSGAAAPQVFAVLMLRQMPLHLVNPCRQMHLQVTAGGGLSRLYVTLYVWCLVKVLRAPPIGGTY